MERPRTGLVVIGVLTVLAAATSNASTKLNIPYVFNQKPSIYRDVYNVLKDRVDDENKLLLAPYQLKYTGGFNNRCYFGDKALYIQHCDAPFDEFVSRNNIRYLFLSQKELKPSYILYKGDTLPCYGAPLKSTDLKKEVEFILEKIASENRKGLIYQSDSGFIFDLAK